MGGRENGASRPVRVVGSGPSTRTIAARISRNEVETVDSVATLSPAAVAVVVVVASELNVSAPTAVERIRRVHGRTPIVIATDDVTPVRAEGVVPIDASAVDRMVEKVDGAERIDRPRRRVGRIVQLAADLDASDDADRVCERLADRVGYEAVWLVQRDEGSVIPVAAAGVPLSALRTVDVDDDAPWARAVRSTETIVEAGDRWTVAVPFGNRCLVCTTDTEIHDTEVSALEHVVQSAPVLSGSLEPGYAILGKAIAHEVNNQLDVAMVHLDLIDAENDHVGHVAAALDRIDSVIDEVNALVAPELSVEPVSLQEVAAEVWSGIETSDASLEGHDGTIEADVRLLRLLLSNLFRNAVRHGGDAVTVEIGPRPDGGFFVSDDGLGFPDDVSEQLFEWGWSDADSSGIGLALVSLVADRHGWTIEHSGDDGARFEFRP